MSAKKNIGCILGTRPEMIKMAPVINALKKNPAFNVTVIASAQHRHLLDQMLAFFGIKPDIDLHVMQQEQRLPQLTARLCERLDHAIQTKKFDVLVAQGDTTTTLAAALIAFYNQIDFGHVEAGLRTYDLTQPFPEEMNRTLISRIASWNFVPTETERQNLLREAVPDSKIFVTGNTVIDALYWTLEKDKSKRKPFFPGKKMLLVTSHRHENWGLPLENICHALLSLSERFPDIEIVYPVHPNPHVKTTVHTLLSHQPRIHLLQPLSYDEFCHYMNEAYLILTDSGGVQEEGPALGKPVLILRNTTERPALLTSGTGLLVGTDTNMIIEQTARLLNVPVLYQQMAKNVSPYGDGKAAARIVNIIQQSAI